MERARFGPARVLLTGSEGFIGQETQKELQANDHQIIPFDLKLGLDLRNTEDLKPLDYDAVIHLAAVSSTPWANASPDMAFSVNHYGTYNLLVDCLRKGVKRVVFASSSRVIDLPLQNAYVVSKKSEEDLVKLFAPEIFTVGLRYTSVYGSTGFERHHSLNVLNQIVKAAMDGTQMDIYGDGSQWRDFVNVNDVARANVLALGSASPGAVDIGCGRSFQLSQIIRLVESIIGRKINVNYTGDYPPDYMHRQEGNLYLAGEMFDYQPQVNLEQGIIECVQSY